MDQFTQNRLIQSSHSPVDSSSSSSSSSSNNYVNQQIVTTATKKQPVHFIHHYTHLQPLHVRNRVSSLQQPISISNTQNNGAPFHGQSPKSHANPFF
jgi:uncharacterized membrane protein